MKILAFDPSGNYHEGKGTTGVCKLIEGYPIELSEIKASDFHSPEQYWDAHLRLITQEEPHHVVIEGYKLYNHKGKAASMQANSTLETPQLIGVLKHHCWYLNIPYHIQFASDVKTRWNEDLLVRQGYLEEKNGRYYLNGKVTSTHKRDSLKHALHFARYKLNKG